MTGLNQLLVPLFCGGCGLLTSDDTELGVAETVDLAGQVFPNQELALLLAWGMTLFCPGSAPGFSFCH